MEFLRTALPFWALFLLTWVCVVCKRKLTAVCSHQTRIGNLDAHLI
ncbi:hypothetical protein BvCmsJ76A_03911 [Escherichia coli]|nr:hypothetical protein BvCmsJ76A_03911 [Escherichia coli]GDK29942.1 hypothetical protein BvCmsKSP018_02367 [Escherichia coli]GDO72362.1 hypothetical protein BvCmsNSP003_01158 [Escherichia coli]GDQ07796.1 hypothetical protein BvCmsNSP052_01112 [Escherichia coli]GDW68063.1 hypothetical protein BvCmsSIP004_01019 [Escherichia coli]